VRVLVLTWEYPPIVEGGLARHVRKLAENLVEQGVEVHVLTRGDRPDEVRAGVHVHRVDEPATPRDDLDGFLRWIEHMNDDMDRAGRELFAAGAFDVVHGHDWLVARAAAALARRADGVVVCSHYMRGQVADVFGVDEARVRVIPNGIDPLDLAPVDDLAALRARFARPSEKLVLLIGRLVYEKGFQVALDALPRVIDRVGDVRFLVAGSGTHEQELKAQAERLGLDRHGTFLGWIGDDVLRSLYRIADLTVVPSLYEPFGLVALEAMASGCPCIVSDTGGLREVVPNDDVGIRVQASDPRALADQMALVLANPALRFRIVTEAAEHIARFDWTEVAARTAALYTELTGDRQLVG